MMSYVIYMREIKIPLKRSIQIAEEVLPDTIVFSLILVGWCEEGHPTTKNIVSTIGSHRQLPYGD